MILLKLIPPTNSDSRWLAILMRIFIAGCAAPCRLPATPAPVVVTEGAAERAPFQDLADFLKKDGAVASGNLEHFWQTVVATGQMPRIFDDTDVFLYRGPGQTVVWRGDFTLWDRAPVAAGTRPVCIPPPPLCPPAAGRQKNGTKTPPAFLTRHRANGRIGQRPLPLPPVG